MKIKKKDIKRMMKTNGKLVYKDSYCLKYHDIVFPKRVICFTFDMKGNLTGMPIN